MKCIDEDTLKCSDCYDCESVLKEAMRIAEKRFGKIDNCEIIVVDEADLKDANRMEALDEQLEKIDRCEILIIDKMDFYTIFYSRNDFSSFGGGFWMKISKKDCKIVDYKISK
jgi:hypothetical protein